MWFFNMIADLAIRMLRLAGIIIAYLLNVLAIIQTSRPENALSAGCFVGVRCFRTVLPQDSCPKHWRLRTIIVYVLG